MQMRRGASNLHHVPKLCLYRVAVAVLLYAGCLTAQTPLGEIRLTVEDPAGAVMQATGKLSSVAGGMTRAFATSAQGEVMLNALPYGHYRVEIARKNFVTQSFELEVTSPAPVARTVRMALSAQTTRVDVVSVTPLPGTDQSIAEI